MVKQATKNEIQEIKKLLLEHYAGAITELEYTNVYELLVAVMLSAQCTDKRVNIITPKLFEIYPTPAKLARANLADLKSIINSCSFFNNKAKNLITMAQKVMSDFDGEIPLNQDDLMSLDGVGQKSANVVLIEYTGANLMAVDTHVFRVSHRLGLSRDKTAIATELTLSKKLKSDLHTLHQAMVLFGRYTCKAKNPQCGECFLASYCKSREVFKA
ncbi:MAG: endonuclease III [Sulfuricurvum sp.]